MHRTILFLLFFFSGCAGLIYEILWMKELGLLFGNGAYAVATTLSVFFLGLGLGSWFWGRRSAAMANPLRVYALLEFGIAGTAVFYFVLLTAYHFVYSFLFTQLHDIPAAFLTAKFLLAVLILLPPAFCMGGTLPVMSQHLIRNPGELSRTGTLLYALNTLGAALGALLAGFVLPRTLGFQTSYFLTMGLSVLVGVLAWWQSMLPAPANAPAEIAPEPAPRKKSRGGRRKRMTVEPGAPLVPIAFLSGLLSLALQVLWTRMFSHSLENTIYIFSAILIVFLLALAVGSLAAKLLARSSWNPNRVLFWLLLASGTGVLTTPFVFFAVGGLSPQGVDTAWATYILRVFLFTAMVIFVPTLINGMVLPYLLKLAEAREESAGVLVGRLVGVNTGGALLGSFLAGFVLLSTLGLWASLLLMGGLYLLAGVVWVFYRNLKDMRLEAVGLMAVVLLAAMFLAPDRSLVSLDDPDHKLMGVYEGSLATVAVVDEAGNLRIKINNHYGLGSLHNMTRQRMQTELALFSSKTTDDVFYLGMGTGFTAATAMRFPVRRITVCELVPEVVQASKDHFSPYLDGFFTDPRVNVVVEDGRNYLLGTDATYDVIVSDFFLPWKAGVGSLYTLENYRAASARLKPGGVFAQWLPTNQCSFEAFATISRTLLEVFDHVTLWRMDYSVMNPGVGFLCSNEPIELSPDVLVSRVQAYTKSSMARTQTLGLVLGRYCGNLTLAKALLTDAEINTDDRMITEYHMPIALRSFVSGESSSFSKERYLDFCEALLDVTPPETDPYLAGLTLAERGFVYAGVDMLKAELHTVRGEPVKAEQALERVRERLEGF